MYAEGSSYKKVAHTFNEEGIPSPRASTWDLSGVRGILLNENYLGHRVWNQTRRNKKVQRGTKVPKPRDEWVIAENAHPAIVDQELWDAAHERRGQIRVHIENGRGNYATTRSNYLLTGLLKCEKCGANFVMTGIKRKGGLTRYYRCSHNANRGSAVCTNGRTIRQDWIEGAVLDALAKRLFTSGTIEALLEEVRASSSDTDGEDQRGQELRQGIRQAEKEIENLRRAIRAGGAIEELVDDLRAIKARKSLLTQDLQEVVETLKAGTPGEIKPEEVAEAIRDLKHTLEFATPIERKELLKEHVTEIRIPRNGPACWKPIRQGCCVA